VQYGTVVQVLFPGAGKFLTFRGLSRINVIVIGNATRTKYARDEYI